MIVAGLLGLTALMILAAVARSNEHFVVTERLVQTVAGTQSEQPSECIWKLAFGETEDAEPIAIVTVDATRTTGKPDELRVAIEQPAETLLTSLTLTFVTRDGLPAISLLPLLGDPSPQVRFMTESTEHRITVAIDDFETQAAGTFTVTFVMQQRDGRTHPVLRSGMTVEFEASLTPPAASLTRYVADGQVVIPPD